MTDRYRKARRFKKKHGISPQDALKHGKISAEVIIKDGHTYWYGPMIVIPPEAMGFPPASKDLPEYSAKIVDIDRKNGIITLG